MPSGASDRAPASRMSRPLMTMLPWRVASRRVISEKSVVLPAPFGPSRAVKRPFSTVKLTSSRTRVGLVGEGDVADGERRARSRRCARRAAVASSFDCPSEPPSRTVRSSFPRCSPIRNGTSRCAIAGGCRPMAPWPEWLPPCSPQRAVRFEIEVLVAAGVGLRRTCTRPGSGRRSAFLVPSSVLAARELRDRPTVPSLLSTIEIRRASGKRFAASGAAERSASAVSGTKISPLPSTAVSPTRRRSRAAASEPPSMPSAISQRAIRRSATSSCTPVSMKVGVTGGRRLADDDGAARMR